MDINFLINTEEEYTPPIFCTRVMCENIIQRGKYCKIHQGRTKPKQRLEDFQELSRASMDKILKMHGDRTRIEKRD